MDTLITTINNSAPLFLTLGIVLVLRKYGVLEKSDAASLGKVLFKIVLPLFTFNIVYNLNFETDNLPVILAVLFANILLLLFVFLGAKLGKLKNKVTGTLLLLSLAYSAGPIAYPFTQLNFDEKVFSQVVIVDIAIFMTILILGPIIASMFDDENKTDIKEIGLSLVKDPTLVGVFLGFAIRIMSIQLPLAITGTLDFITPSFTLLVTIFVGLTITLPNLRSVKLLSLIMLFRAISSLTISFIIISIFNPPTELALAIPLVLFMAFSSFPIVYTDKYNLDSDLVAQASVFSRIFIYITYPMLIVVLKSIFY